MYNVHPQSRIEPGTSCTVQTKFFKDNTVPSEHVNTQDISNTLEEDYFSKFSMRRVTVVNTVLKYRHIY
jgi:hypothetical protein